MPHSRVLKEKPKDEEREEDERHGDDDVSKNAGLLRREEAPAVHRKCRDKNHHATEDNDIHQPSSLSLNADRVTPRRASSSPARRSISPTRGEQKIR